MVRLKYRKEGAMSNALQDYKGAADIGITPDDSPAMDEMLQGVTPLTEVAPQPQGLQLKTTGGDTLIEQIELFLRARWIFRYNVVSNKAEFKLVKDPDAPFVEMRDFDYNSILKDLKYADLQCSMSTLRMILASKFMVEYDPYIEYTVNLPEYDGQTDYIEQLADIHHHVEIDFLIIALYHAVKRLCGNVQPPGKLADAYALLLKYLLEHRASQAAHLLHYIKYSIASRKDYVKE